MSRLILTKDGGLQEFPLGAETTIGRGSQNNIVLEGSGISREHAKIVAEENQYYLIDLKSDNGTLLNGVLLKPLEKNLLKENDRLSIQEIHLKFKEQDITKEQPPVEAEEITDVDILEIKMVKKILDAVDRDTIPSLEILNGTAQGKRFFLTDDTEEMTIGRDPECDACIPEDVISRQHAKVAKRWGGIALIDLDSRNGCFVNNKRIKEEFLHDGDRLALGTVVLLFRNPKEINLKEIEEEISKKRPVRNIRPLATATPTLSEEPPVEGYPTASANLYPPVEPAEKRLTPLEIGLIGLGLAVFCLAAITLVNLLME